MSTVRLSDAIEPSVFANYMSVNMMQKSAFYGTGVMRSDGDLAGKLAGGGRTFNVPFWRDLDDEEPDAASDDRFAEGRAGHWQFDLEGYVARRLETAEIGAVERLRLDTYAAAERFYSYRRTTHRGEATYGRQLSLIGL